MSTLQTLLHRSPPRHGPSRRPLRRPIGSCGRAAARMVPPPRIAAPVKDGWRVFDARVVGQFRADAKYTAFLVDDQEYIISEPLNALEQRLVPHGFLRVHRGVLVNLFAVRALHRTGRRVALELMDGASVHVSRRMAQEVLRALGIEAERPTSSALMPSKASPEQRSERC